MSSQAIVKTSSQRGDLTKYDPDKGLKRVAVFEAAEKHYARAKDIKGLREAIREKLEHQAEFVLWWKTRDKNKAGRPAKSITDRLSILKDEDLAKRLGTRLMTISRWKRKLDDPNDFEATFEHALSRYVKILELEQGAHVSENTGETEWFTPTEYAEAARVVLGAIDLDPASTEDANRVIKAAQFFSSQENGLDQQWDGRVWMNPPYAQPLVTQFCEKLAASVRAGTVTDAVVLVNNATETQWFRALADVAAAICFPTGRVRFWHPAKDSATPLQGQAVLYIGDDVPAFVRAFSVFGFLTVVTHDATA